MDREDALSLLPEDYANALRLRDAGHTMAAIAARLGIDVDAIATLLEIGDVKLRRVLGPD